MDRQPVKESLQRYLEAYKESTKSQRAYCEESDLNLRRFQYYLRKSRKVEGGKSHSQEKQRGWLPFAIVDELGGSPGGIRIKVGRVTVEADPGFDAPHLSAVLRALGAVC
jgi:hypothetical protein